LFEFFLKIGAGQTDRCATRRGGFTLSTRSPATQSWRAIPNVTRPPLQCPPSRYGPPGRTDLSKPIHLAAIASIVGGIAPPSTPCGRMMNNGCCALNCSASRRQSYPPPVRLPRWKKNGRAVPATRYKASPIRDGAMQTFGGASWGWAYRIRAARFAPCATRRGITDACPADCHAGQLTSFVVQTAWSLRRKCLDRDPPLINTEGPVSFQHRKWPDLHPIGWAGAIEACP
jgi:hypothetical protein